MKLLRRRIGRGTTGRDRDRGAAILEFAGFLPILLIVAMAGIQLGIIGYAASQAGTAARAAARTEAQEELRGQGEATGKAAMSDWLAGETVITFSGNITATARVPIPSVVPGIPDFGHAVEAVTMPPDQEER
ncbi:TadE/TadG family type IV pilus assembly protein [Streptomyces chryseus]|uniref:Septum formation initiator n=1 Tax=Streptomyces chryseus TaxID=68186 RepID=A0ABQ3EFW5_9ACTN|nr:TadE family protein [Streptomyces chryseus]GHB33292.1 septum formation initiator [Streptomyces chryseus]